MAKFKITTPDGREVVVDADDGASEIELIRMAETQQERKPPTFAQKALASGPVRALKGMKEPIDAAAQMLPRGLSSLSSGFGMLPNRVSEFFDKEAAGVDEDIKDSENEYQAARFATGQSGFDGARALGNFLSPANIAIGMRAPQAITTAGRVATGALAGAAGGGLQPVTDISETSFGMQKAGQVGIGAAGGAVFAPIVGKVFDLVAPVVKSLQAKMTPASTLSTRASMETDVAITKALRDAGMDEFSVPEATKIKIRRQVLDAFKSGKKVDAAALMRQADFKALELPYMQPQTTRDPKTYSQMMNLRGVDDIGLDGNPIRDTLIAQNRGMTQQISSFGGPKAQTPEGAGRSMVEALKASDDSSSAAVTAAYRAARDSAGKSVDVPMQGLASDIGSIVEDFGVGAERNAIPSVVFNRLKSFGIVGDDAMSQRKVFDFEAADKILKQINSHDDGQNASLAALRAAVKKAITEPVGAADPFTPARKLAAQRFAKLDAIPGLEAAAASRNPVAMSRLADDFVKKNLIDAKPSDVRRLAAELPGEQFQEAKRQLAARLYQGAFGNNASGDKTIRADGLQSAIRQIGREKLAVFFSPEEMQQIERSARVAAYINTDPSGSAVSRGSNIGGALFGQMRQLPGMGSVGAVGQTLLSPVLRASRAASVMNQAAPSAPNLSPEEVRAVTGLLGAGSFGVGGLLAPGP